MKQFCSNTQIILCNEIFGHSNPESVGEVKEREEEEEIGDEEEKHSASAESDLPFIVDATQTRGAETKEQDDESDGQDEQANADYQTQ